MTLNKEQEKQLTENIIKLMDRINHLSTDFLLMQYFCESHKPLKALDYYIDFITNQLIADKESKGEKMWESISPEFKFFTRMMGENYKMVFNEITDEFIRICMQQRKEDLQKMLDAYLLTSSSL